MKVRVFQSDKGDCLLLTSRDGRRVLADGGMRDSYRAYVAPALGRIATAGHRLDLVYLSHIDQDHIAGVLQLMKDAIDWRVHEFQVRAGNGDHPAPPRPRPPQIAQVWHNAFSDQVGDEAQEIEEMLAATASVLGGSSLARDQSLAEEHQDLATSISEAIELTHQLGADLLNIPVNRDFGRKLALVRPGQAAIKLGSLSMTVVGPFADDLDALRREWNEWVRKNRSKVEEIRDRTRRDAERLASGDLDGFRMRLQTQADELGDRDQVTAPNLASLMLLVEEGSRTALLTGDGHAREVSRGLAEAGKLDGNNACHVDVLKLQHHGSEHNVDPDFLRRITANHYVICGNGSHGNPDPRVVEAIIRARCGSRRQRTTNPDADRPFKLWFNSSRLADTNESNRDHMEEIEDLVTRRAQAHGRRLRFFFLKGASFTIRLD